MWRARPGPRRPLLLLLAAALALLLLPDCTRAQAASAEGAEGADDEGGEGAEDGGDGEEVYLGKLIGEFKSYHHQVAGRAYAADEQTLVLTEFSYDGLAHDAYLWAGEAGAPGAGGYLVPDERGTTNVLRRYHGAALAVRLPAPRSVRRLRWLALYDVARAAVLADLLVPEGFEPPAPLQAPPPTPQPHPRLAFRAAATHYLDADTLLLKEVWLEGVEEEDEVYWWAGRGAAPSARGRQLPDELGYLEPLRAYRGEDVTLRAGGAHGLRALSYLAVWDARAQRPLAFALLPPDLNVPPAPAALPAPAAAAGHAPAAPAPVPPPLALPHCAQLHRDLQMRWDVFGGQLTIQLQGQIEEDEYMALGLSAPGEAAAEQGEGEGWAHMVGGDAAVAWWAGGQGRVVDYTLSARAPCAAPLPEQLPRGACPDTALRRADNLQLLFASRHQGTTTVIYRRQLKPDEEGDLEWVVGEGSVVRLMWAVGRIDREGRPGFHHKWSRRAAKLRMDAPPHAQHRYTCLRTQQAGPAGQLASPANQPAWERGALGEGAAGVQGGARHYRVTLGPGGGRRGWGAGRADVAPPALVLYVEGRLAPELVLRRGAHYTLAVRAGTDPHSDTLYHPLIVTDEPRGGYEQLSAAERERVRVLAGVEHTRRGRPRPTVAGPLCLAAPKPHHDRRRDDLFPSFRAYNRSLQWSCEPAPAGDGQGQGQEEGLLHLAPDNSWPDLVYYHSYRHRDMGGLIRLVDRRPRASRAPRPARAAPLLLPALLLLPRLLPRL